MLTRRCVRAHSVTCKAARRWNGTTVLATFSHAMRAARPLLPLDGTQASSGACAQPASGWLTHTSCSSGRLLRDLKRADRPRWAAAALRSGITSTPGRCARCAPAGQAVPSQRTSSRNGQQSSSAQSRLVCCAGRADKALACTTSQNAALHARDIHRTPPTRGPLAAWQRLHRRHQKS
jgi:hypothetical protein